MGVTVHQFPTRAAFPGLDSRFWLQYMHQVLYAAVPERGREEDGRLMFVDRRQVQWQLFSS